MKRVASWILYTTIPVAIYLQATHGDRVWLFVFACLAVLPLAAWIGASTEQLARRMGPTVGALFNATFGNLAELIIALFAIRAGLPDVVRASLSGSVVGNLLFVGGLSMFVGGWRRQTLKFNALSAESQAGQLILALSAVLVPALFSRGDPCASARADPPGVDRNVDHSDCLVRARVGFHIQDAPVGTRGNP